MQGLLKVSAVQGQSSANGEGVFKLPVDIDINSESTGALAIP